MSFRIAAIETCIVDHPIISSRMVVSPAGRHDTSRFLTIAMTDADGVRGYGEAATTVQWSGETAETGQCLVRELFAPLLVGNSFDHPCEVLALLDGAAFGNSFTKSALDCAAWDIWARRQNASASQLFGDRTPLRSLPTRSSVGCYDVDKTVQISTEFWDAGIRTLKFKVGLPRFDDAARLRAVREALGDEPVFTVDANGAYGTLQEAVNAIEALQPFNVAVFEQPTPRDRIALLSEVKRRVSTPIMADECVFSRDDLREVLDCDACDVVSLYPGKNGGLSHSIEMAKLALQYGKPCAVGSNLETDLGQAAMIAMAASLSAFPAEQMICDLPAVLFYENSSILAPLKFIDGTIEVPTGSGLGVEPVTA